MTSSLSRAEINAIIESDIDEYNMLLEDDYRSYNININDLFQEMDVSRYYKQLATDNRNNRLRNSKKSKGVQTEPEAAGIPPSWLLAGQRLVNDLYTGLGNMFNTLYHTPNGYCKEEGATRGERDADPERLKHFTYVNGFWQSKLLPHIKFPAADADRQVNSEGFKEELKRFQDITLKLRDIIPYLVESDEDSRSRGDEREDNIKNAAAIETENTEAAYGDAGYAMPQQVDSVTCTSAPQPVDSVTCTSAPQPVDSVTCTSAPQPVDSVTCSNVPQPVDSSSCIHMPQPVHSSSCISIPQSADSSSSKCSETSDLYFVKSGYSSQASTSGCKPTTKKEPSRVFLNGKNVRFGESSIQRPNQAVAVSKYCLPPREGRNVQLSVPKSSALKKASRQGVKSESTVKSDPSAESGLIIVGGKVADGHRKPLVPVTNSDESGTSGINASKAERSARVKPTSTVSGMDSDSNEGKTVNGQKSCLKAQHVPSKNFIKRNILASKTPVIRTAAMKAKQEHVKV